ncbi:branched-chain amino acid ABC transporter ATP-binding protein (plasmid) [Rhizobium gallicum]|uniref:Branched-chain amino acid ABC transporter ATP-binding protein n=1 Tax=Rhizobium gallicum TaxID=56730 RepID=A0A1L5NS37_9HYPH|nr:ABC transporter ATP-binding protein [Rhizobium gallicum]APO70713.1 branched-chain amino acid ABC transporter ATP-binding protein [Rhizobium gallicum]
MLEVSGLQAGYGSMTVLRDIELSVSEGEVLLVVGENGAGKSTLLQTIGGFICPSAGSIRFGGKEVGGQAPRELVRQGIRLVLDGHRVFPDMRVRDNLALGAAFTGANRLGLSDAIEEIFSIFPILKEKRDAHARDLSGGQQQMLALSQAFIAKPKILLCDEPSLGLAQALMPQILAFLERLTKDGVTIVLVEQHYHLAVPISNSALLLDRGQVQFTCRADELEARLHAERVVA